MSASLRKGGKTSTFSASMKLFLQKVMYQFYTINMIIVNVVVVVHPPIHLVTAGGECGGPRGLEVLSPLAETVVPELEDFSQLKGTTTTTLCAT